MVLDSNFKEFIQLLNANEVKPISLQKKFAPCLLTQNIEDESKHREGG